MWVMSIVDAVLARVTVGDIDRALPLYEVLSGTNEVQRFRFAVLLLRKCGRSHVRNQTLYTTAQYFKETLAY
jgi:hypothetical protein